MNIIIRKEKLEKLYWEDSAGRKWFPTRVTFYPNGVADKIHLEGDEGRATWIRYNQLGEPIAGALDYKVKTI